MLFLQHKSSPTSEPTAVGTPAHQSPCRETGAVCWVVDMPGLYVLAAAAAATASVVAAAALQSALATPGLCCVFGSISGHPSRLTSDGDRAPRGLLAHPWQWHRACNRVAVQAPLLVFREVTRVSLICFQNQMLDCWIDCKGEEWAGWQQTQHQQDLG